MRAIYTLAWCVQLFYFILFSSYFTRTHVWVSGLIANTHTLCNSIFSLVVWIRKCVGESTISLRKRKRTRVLCILLMGCFGNLCGSALAWCVWLWMWLWRCKGGVLLHDDVRFGYAGTDGLVWKNTSAVDIKLICNMHILAQDRHVLHTHLMKKKTNTMYSVMCVKKNEWVLKKKNIIDKGSMPAPYDLPICQR